MQDQGWKLITSVRPRKDWLFNLGNDPTEKSNLAATQPEQLARLQALLKTHHAQMPPPMWESFFEAPIFIDKTLDQTHTPQDEYAYWYN